MNKLLNIKLSVLMSYGQNLFKQECIPVGCVPPRAVAVCLGGVYLSVSWGTHHPQARPLNFPPWVWAWRPPRPALEIPPWPDPSTFPPGCGPGDHPGLPWRFPPRTFINTRLLVHKHVKISVDEWILETTRPQKHVRFWD